MSLADEIEKLNRLKQSGSLTEQEYQQAKARVLSGSDTFTDKAKRAFNQISFEENTWGMLVHLSQLCGYLLPLAGIVVPIILWQVKKNQSTIVDQHGRVVTNWIISWAIYLAISGVLTMIVIGYIGIIAVLLMGIIFPIIGAIKAGSGEVWEYPLSIRFFQVGPVISKT